MFENNSTYNYFVEALKNLLLTRFNLNKAALARDVGFSHSYVTNIINHTKPASYEAQTQIAEKLGFDLYAFLSFGKALQEGDNSIEISPDIKLDFVYIPKVEAQLAAGHGSLETSDTMTGLYSFRSDWIRRMGSPKNMVLMEVVGDSMAPVVLDGDTVLLDQSKTILLPNKIFAVRVEDLIYLKYIDREPGKFVLRSHNPDYPPIYIDTEYLHDTSFQILGRAVWWSHAEISNQ